MNPLSLDGMVKTLAYYRAFQTQELHVLGHDYYQAQVALAGQGVADAAVNNNNININPPEGRATVPVTQLCHITDTKVTMADLAKFSRRRQTLYCPGVTDYSLLPQFHTVVQQKLPSPPPLPQALVSTAASPPEVAPATPSELPLSQSFTNAGFFTILFKKSPWLKYMSMKLTLKTAQEWIAQPSFKELGLDKCLYQYKATTGLPATMAHTNFLTVCLVFIVALTVFATSAEAGNLPVWCYCHDNAKTQWCCQLSSGNWDGGSCGLTTAATWNNFEYLCKANGGGLNCWH
ncbi:hypothetical protein BGZ83_002331 [Gryganskiella cystojenkinii]|nr:hypothetical protein BGZ83_002331 [Gryganskiella cystojenkinii]